MAKTDGTRKMKPSEARALKKARQNESQLQESRSTFARPIHEFPDLEDVLPALCEEYREIADQMRVLEERRKELSSEIEPLMAAVEWNSIMGDKWHAVRVLGKRKSLSPEKLLENGVSIEQLELSTIEKEYWYIQVREATVEPPSVEGD